MSLSTDLISQFVKTTKDTKKESSEGTAYGQIVKYNGENYVKLDGSDLLTPMSSTTVVEEGDRVLVTIKDHNAIVTGSTTSPSASNKDVVTIGNKINEFEIVIADKVSTKELDAQIGRIDELTADNVTIKKSLTATEAEIKTLTADNVTIKGDLTANTAEIETLKTNKLDATVADLKYAEIKDLEATNADIHNLKAEYGDFKTVTTDKLTAQEANITKLDTEKLSATQADIKYAQIDFANIDMAAVEKLFTESGIIKDLVVSNGQITGELVGVTIKGDLIEGNTIVADKLVVKGSDGLYYKLNLNGETVEANQTEYNSLNGSVITAKSITATKISVDDLVAFDATIAGLNMTNGSIYSGVKSSVDNSTQGFYLDKNGQMALGDSNNFVKYYKGPDGKYRLEIKAETVLFGSGGNSIEDIVGGIREDVNSLKDEITTLLRIESSRGTIFKNDNISTVLSAVIYHGTQRITDSVTMKQVFGSGAYLQWKWQHLNDNTYGIISSDDSRFGNDGFTFTLSPKDVNTKVTFMCELIT